MKGEAKEGFENNLHHYEIIKTNSRAYLDKHGCSAQEDVYHILSELKLSRVFPAVHFVNTTALEERAQVLLFEKDIFLRIFLRNQILVGI